MSFLAELKRRNVVRVGLAYVLLGWLLLQVTDIVVPLLVLPDWVARLVFFLLAIGFPVALFLAWAFELTPDGIKREKEVDRDQSVTHQTGRKLDRFIIMAMAAGIVFLIVDRYHHPSDSADLTQPPTNPAAALPDSAQTPSEKSVAVLPFVNMSDDKANEYFSDGISEELLNVLVRVEGLRVPSRTSSFTFKGSNKKLSEVGAELNVDHILEGSVRKSGDRVRVTAQLIDVHTDSHLWSETYTRKLDDIFAVQDEISGAIIDALKVTLTGEEKQAVLRRSTQNADAYNKYLQGRHLWNQRSIESLLAAIDPLREAIELDPGFDQAWAALADVYVLLPEYGAGTIDEHIPLARQAAARALEINPDSARALTTSGYIKAMFDFDFPGAMADYRRAIELQPEYPTAHQWYAETLAVQRRHDDAMAELRIARKLDPLAPIISHVMGWLSEGVGDLAAARQYYEEALQLDPHFNPSNDNLKFLLVREGNYSEARQYEITIKPFVDALENPALKPAVLDYLATTPDLADGTMEKAWLYLNLGEHELAMNSLEAGLEAGDPYASHVNRIKAYDVLRGNPRFQAHLARMNLAEP